MALTSEHHVYPQRRPGRSDHRRRQGDAAAPDAKVLRVLPEKNKIVVEGVNRVYKHLKPSAKNPQGGRLSKEMPIDASNVMLFCPTLQPRRPRRPPVHRRRQKERYCKKCAASLGQRRPRQAAPTPRSSQADRDRPARPDRHDPRSDCVRTCAEPRRDERMTAHGPLARPVQHEIVPALAKKFGRTNKLAIPKLEKIVINMGVGKATAGQGRCIEAAVEQPGARSPARSR